MRVCEKKREWKRVCERVRDREVQFLQVPQKRPINPLKEPISPQKRPQASCSTVLQVQFLQVPQKKPIYPQKSPIHPRKSHKESCSTVLQVQSLYVQFLQVQSLNKSACYSIYCIHWLWAVFWGYLLEILKKSACYSIYYIHWLWAVFSENLLEILKKSFFRQFTTYQSLQTFFWE